MTTILAQVPCDPTTDRTCQVPTGPGPSGPDCTSSPTACPAPPTVPGPFPPDPTVDLTVTGTQSGSDPTATGDQFVASSPVAASVAGTPAADAVFTESVAAAPAQLPATGTASMPIAGGGLFLLVAGMLAVWSARRRHVAAS